MNSSKRNWLSLRKKVEILDFRKNNKNLGVRILAEKFHKGKKQIVNIVFNEKDFYKTWIEIGNDERK